MRKLIKALALQLSLGALITAGITAHDWIMEPHRITKIAEENHWDKAELEIFCARYGLGSYELSFPGIQEAYRRFVRGESTGIPGALIHEITGGRRPKVIYL